MDHATRLDLASSAILMLLPVQRLDNVASSQVMLQGAHDRRNDLYGIARR
jgi:hypothetical protein